MSPTIRLFRKDDWNAVSEIYEQGLLTRNATFETELPDYDNWVKRFRADLLWVAASADQIIGWAGLQPVSSREVYKGVVEVSIYIHKELSGKGIGSALLKHLISESENEGIWTLYASIFPQNTASVRLHLSAGFREIGFREKIAQLDGKWRNTVLFERRSKIVGK